MFLRKKVRSSIFLWKPTRVYVKIQNWRLLFMTFIQYQIISFTYFQITVYVIEKITLLLSTKIVTVKTSEGFSGCDVTIGETSTFMFYNYVTFYVLLISSFLILHWYFIHHLWPHLCHTLPLETYFKSFNSDFFMYYTVCAVQIYVCMYVETSLKSHLQNQR